MGVLIPFIVIVISGWIIWMASDGFEAASAYIGRNLSNGVRGATINAIASSMPEFFVTLFFLFYLNDEDGFSGGIGTTAGSSLFNGMIIPACVVLAAVIAKLGKDIIVSRRMMIRDGIFLLIAISALILIIQQGTLYWYHGLILMFLYFVYLAWLFLSGGIDKEGAGEFVQEDKGDKDSVIKDTFTLDLYGLIIGDKKLNSLNAWILLLSSTVIMGGSCMLLVHASEWLGAKTYTLPFFGELQGLNIPLLFVALIIAAAASSLPDTIISIKDSRKGNFNDAISNALGSNIFDVCFALGFPLFLFGLIKNPITMNPEFVDGYIVPILIVLLIFTLLSFAVYVIGRKMTIIKAILLITFYLLFIVYVTAKSLAIV
jgi:cation:H+ antiporter